MDFPQWKAGNCVKIGHMMISNKRKECRRNILGTKLGNKMRIERCKDCPCLMEMPASKYFCDEYQKPCIDVMECGEWENDPTDML